MPKFIRVINSEISKLCFESPHTTSKLATTFEYPSLSVSTPHILESFYFENTGIFNL